MRLLAEYSTQKEAQALLDFMEVKGVEVDLRSGKKHAIWVLDDDSLPRAQTLMAGFVPSEKHAMAAGKIRSARKAKTKPAAKPKTQARPTEEMAIGPLTVAMIAASALVAFATKLGQGDIELISKVLVVPVTDVGGNMISFLPDLQWNQPWRLLTPMFLHFGIMHIVFNMMWLFRFGNQIEARHGSLVLLLIAVVAQIGGSIAQFHISGPMFGGMSGVVYAVFGFVWMQSKYGTRGYALEQSTAVWLMGWLLLCATGMVGSVANAAHAVGLAAGLLAGLPAYLQYRKAYAKRSIEKGSWADLNLSDWQRFHRQFVEPYIPLWFMAAALGVLLMEFR